MDGHVQMLQRSTRCYSNPWTHAHSLAAPAGVPVCSGTAVFPEIQILFQTLYCWIHFICGKTVYYNIVGTRCGDKIHLLDNKLHPKSGWTNRYLWRSRSLQYANLNPRPLACRSHLSSNAVSTVHPPLPHPHALPSVCRPTADAGLNLCAHACTSVCCSVCSMRRMLENVGLFFARDEDSPPSLHSSSRTILGQMHREDVVPNQDAYFAKRFGDTLAVAVFDGHGDAGHFASALASEQMLTALAQLLNMQGNNLDGPVTMALTTTRPNLAQVATDSFRSVAAAVVAAECGRDSGTTGTLVLVRERECVIAHVGDSAAVVVAQHPVTRRYLTRFVSPMHRPALKGEAARVQKAGGILVEGYVVDQVTKKKGISITRTLGDSDMAINGCISEPDVMVMELTKHDRAIVVASDGLWDTKGVSFKNIGKAIFQAGGNAQLACDALFRQVHNAGGASDDCTVVVTTVQRQHPTR